MLCPITVQVSEGSALEDYNSPGPHRPGVSSKNFGAEKPTTTAGQFYQCSDH